MTKKNLSPLGQWLDLKFIDWQKECNQRMTWAAFAQYLGVSTMTLNRWTRSRNKPLDETIDMLAKVLCDDAIYRITGRPTPTVRQLHALTIDLPDDLAKELIAMAGKLRNLKE